jgi:murein DD-endopeptidase MepM/ murein hydrolase activator NlpD
MISALALAIAALGAPTAFAQTSGGIGSPGGTEPPPPTTTPTDPAAPAAFPQVFPLPGAHTYGDGFGAARKGHTHMGQDVMAACGSPLVAVSRAKVVFSGFQGAAGNYVVLRYKKLHQDYAYMHMATPAIVAKKSIVMPGQQVGVVGDTGDASACHLHFELWQGKWYRGGHAVDPTATLQYWDSYS